MNIRQCRGILNSQSRASPNSGPFRKTCFLPWGCSCPRPTGTALAKPRNTPAMSSETAWKARYARLWKAAAKPDVPYRALSHQRVMVALEAYRQLALPGLPGPTALGRVADVTMETAGHVLAELKAPARDSAP